MKHMKTIERHIAKKSIVDFIECDFCGKKTDPRGDWGRDSMTATGREDTDHPLVVQSCDPLHMKSLFSYSSDCWNAFDWHLDICPACFESKILPLATPAARVAKETY